MSLDVPKFYGVVFIVTLFLPKNAFQTILVTTQKKFFSFQVNRFPIRFWTFFLSILKNPRTLGLQLFAFFLHRKDKNTHFLPLRKSTPWILRKRQKNAADLAGQSWMGDGTGRMSKKNVTST